jgi:hypothetical protein
VYNKNIKICCFFYFYLFELLTIINKFFWNFERIISPVIEVNISCNTIWNLIFRKESFWYWGNLAPWRSIKWLYINKSLYNSIWSCFLYLLTIVISVVNS